MKRDDLPSRLPRCPVDFISNEGCGLGEHVRTTSPYTFMVATLSIVLGSIPVGMGLYGPWTALLVGTGAMSAIAYGVGNKAAGASDSKKLD